MKRNNVISLIILLIIFWVTMLATACGSAPATPAPTSTATATIVATATAPISTPTVNEEDEAAGGSPGKRFQDLTVEDIAKIVAERPPVPAPTPGPVDKLVERVTDQSGLAGRSFLGLRTKDWVNLGISVLIVLIGSLLVIPLLFGILNWAVHRTKTQFDDDFLATIGRELRWLVVIILTREAALRLELQSIGVRNSLADLFFFLTSGVLYIIALRLVTFAGDRYLDHRKSEADRKRWEPITVSLKRLGYFFVTLVALSIFSRYLGLDVTLPAVVFVFLAAVIVIAARTTIDDAINGFVILNIRPFRVGDIILIKDLNNRGNVVEIGLLTTKLHTGDNRLVIIPNSQIAQSQVVNYSYPDPSFRVQTDIGVAYGTDIKLMRQVIEETVRGVKDVLPDKPINVSFQAFGASSRQVRVQWWVETVNHDGRTLDRVNEALEFALDAAGIDMPNPTYDLNLKSDITN